VLTWAAWLVIGGPCTEILLDAEIGAHLREIHGTVTCRMAAGGILDVATYPGVLRERDGLDDVNQAWFYPSGFDPAAMRLAVDGALIDAHSAWHSLGPRSPGKRVAVEFLTRVPRRNGTLGVYGHAGYFLGGWHPAFGSRERLDAAPIRFVIRVPVGMVGVVGGVPVTRDGPRVVSGSLVGRFVPVVLAASMRVIQWPGAILLAPQSRPHGLKDITAFRDDGALDQLRQTLAEGAAFAERLAIDSPSTPLLVVLAPLREHLVERFDGGIAVSDRAFHLLPFERVLKFHRLSVWREQLAARVLPMCRRLEDELPADLIADLVGSGLRERLAMEKYGAKEYAPELLETFAVIPEIDSLIFAPQISFVDTYFAAIDETPRRRWRLDNFFHQRPRGKLLYEKLVDVLGSVAVQDLIAAYVQGSIPFLKVGEVAGWALEPLISPWLGPYPAIDYSIDSVTFEDEQARVTIGARGPDSRRLREPITVEVVDDQGEQHRASRMGPGEIVIGVPNPPQRVEIDPDNRLVEVSTTPGKGPRFNNRRPPRWRFLLNNIASLIAVTNKELSVAADFSLRRIHDLRHSLGFFASYGPSSIAAATSYRYAFGRSITPLRLVQSTSLSVAYERLRSERGRAETGDQVSLSAGYRYDDRLSPYWACSGKGASLRLAGALGWPHEGDHYLFLRTGASAFYIWSLAFNHALVGRVRGDLNMGGAPLQDGLSLGHLYRAGRGFERDEARGDLRIVATTEYRHVLTADGRTDLGGLINWNRLEGGLFADVVYLSVNDPADCGRNLFYDIGYGLRFIGNVLGVTPAEITIDVGVPLGRCPSATTRPPVTVYVGFVQSLAEF
jgi:hypothetical protein